MRGRMRSAGGAVWREGGLARAQAGVSEGVKVSAEYRRGRTSGQARVRAGASAGGRECGVRARGCVWSADRDVRSLEMAHVHTLLYW